MSTTVSSGSTATFGMDAFASLAVVPSSNTARGTITFTSAAPKSRSPSFTAKLQTKEFGPFLVPMSVSIVVEDGSCTYQLTGNAGGYSYDSSNNVTGLVGPDGNPYHESADWRGGEDRITTKSEVLWDFTDQAALPTLTDCTAAVDPLITRWSGATLAVTPSASTAQFRKPSISISLDPVQQLASIDVYCPSVISGQSISVTLYNVNYGANYTTWTFNGNALRQGWNTLKLWCGDTNAATTLPLPGTLGFGCSKAIGGTGLDATSPITHAEVNLYNLSGVQINFDGLRKGGKAKTCVVLGFDATGIDGSDTVFTKSGGVADFFKASGFRGYFVSTAIWDLFPGSGFEADAARKDVLYKQYGWDCLPHFWNHGASAPGATVTATSATRTGGNLVTFTANASLEDTFLTAMPTGKKFYAMISGATTTDFNGLAYVTVTGTTTFTYASAGANVTTAGTVLAKTDPFDVIDTDDATRRAIMRHELVDLVRLLRARGWNRGLTIGAYPHNSVGIMEVMQPICAEAGIKFFRGIKKTTVGVTEFGVDNPLHFGSAEIGNSSTSPTLTEMIASLTGAIGRGDDFWTYGHHIIDETDPANIAHVNADLNYGPGQGGNPLGSAPSSGTWYFGTLKKFVNETLLPLQAAGTITIKSPTEWAANTGNIGGTY